MRNRISLLKIIDSIFVILFFIFIGYLLIDLSNISKTLKETQKEKMLLLADTQNDIYSSLLRFGFYDELKENLISLVDKNPNVRGVELSSKDFNFKYPKKELKLPSVKSNLVYNGKNLGVIKIYYSYNSVLNNFFAKYFHRFIIYLILILPFILYLWYFVRRKIKRLNLLAKKVEKIDFRKINKLEEIDNYYEILYIIKAINKLLSQINNFYKSQKAIIKKLIKYKKQLQTAQKVAKIGSWEWDCDSEKFESLFKNFLRFKNIDDFVNSLENKDEFIEKLKKICKNCSSYKDVKKFEDYYIKIDAKCFVQINKKVIIGTLLDITEEVKRQEKIEFLAYHDTLTGLANRSFLKEHLNYLINIAKRNKTKFAIMYLDLDNFKMINDNYGHEVGDKVLIQVAEKLKNIVRSSDLIARIGGDEFIVILNHIKDKKDAGKVAEKIIEMLKNPIKVNDKNFYVTFSIGIASYPDDSEDIGTLFKYADIAMYKAKKEGKNRFDFIDETIKNEVQHFYEITSEIKEGIEKREFELYLQPQIDIVNNKIYGAEALIRWNHPKKGLLAPASFIPYAEKNSLISLIDDFVLEEAMKILSSWQNNDFLKNLKLSVNISAKGFRKNNFLDEVRDLLEKYKIKPKMLEIEITESVSMEDIAYTVKVLEKLKKLGVLISLDDFGTGYSSLNYLKMIPFDIIKIDQTFVRDISKNRDDFLITKMIVEISKILNKKTIAEGVEKEEILNVIKNLGCRYVQGYYFSKPLKERDFYEYILSFNSQREG